MMGSDIGVIAPYVAQTSAIRNLLTSDSETRTYMESKLGANRAKEIEKIEVKTVDGFEGREKQVIIFSTVRNNDYGRIGFLADRRRLNVGLTRAKRALFILGSAKTLGATAPPSSMERSAVSTWKKYLQWLEGEKLIVVLRGPALHRAMASKV